MPRIDLDSHFSRIDNLAREINELVPNGGYKQVQFRADLAGLLVVAMAATYETCVKDVLYDFANRHHIVFGAFTQRNYEKLNSRIRLDDLKKYCRLFDDSISQRFKTLLADRKNKILGRSGTNIETSYDQILTWRHDFAHAGIRNTTIEEAIKTHRAAKRVLYTFDAAFNVK